MQVRDCYNDEGVTVKTVHHGIRESPQATTANAWFDFWIRLRKSKRPPNGSV